MNQLRQTFLYIISKKGRPGQARSLKRDSRNRNPKSIQYTGFIRISYHRLPPTLKTSSATVTLLIINIGCLRPRLFSPLFNMLDIVWIWKNLLCAETCPTTRPGESCSTVFPWPSKFDKNFSTFSPLASVTGVSHRELWPTVATVQL